MADLLDLFDDDPAPPVPTPAPRPTTPAAPRAAPIARPASPGPRPTARLHLCQAPGCRAWGSHGIFTGDFASSQWWCAEHLPPSFWECRDRNAAEGLAKAGASKAI